MAASIAVFGGSSGMGEAAARLFALKGFLTTIVGRDQGRIDAALARINADLPSGAQPASGVSVDATSRAAVDAFFATRRFDHVVLAQSGPKGSGAFRELKMDDLRQAIEEKLLSQLQVAQAALPSLAPRGSITFIGGAASRAALVGTAGWAAINGGLDRAAATLAKELAPLRVNVVSPGVVDTPAWAHYGEQTRKTIFEGLAKQLPAGRVGTVEDIAHALLFVVENTFVTGIVLDVNGGNHLI